MRKYLIATFIFLSLFSNAQSDKRIFGFLGDWHYWESRWDYFDLHKKYITDLCVSFAMPNSNGSLRFSSGGDFWGTLRDLRTATANENIRCHIAVGGWSVSYGETGPGDPFYEMATNDEARAIFVDNIVDMCRNYNLDGVIMDWEYPPSNGEVIVEQLLLDVKLGLLALEEETGRKYEMSIAVSATSYGSSAYNYTSITFCDYVMVMAFDNTSAPHHSSVDFAEETIDYWIDNRDVPNEKIILAIPFYSKGTASGSYYNFSNNDPATYYYDEDGTVGPYRYNSQPMIKEKLDYGASRNIGGAFIWELWDDRSDQYSLSRYMYSYYFPNDVPPLNTNTVNEYNPGLAVSFANNNFTHSWENNSNQGYQIEIYDLTGKRIFQTLSNQNSGGSEPIPTDWTDGIYIVRFFTKTESVSSKVYYQK
jgi:GH18 family chitinase